MPWANDSRWVIYGRSITDHRSKTDQAKSPHVSKLELPQTDEGSALPLIYGRCRVKSPILIYAGKLQTKIVDNSNNGAQYVVYALDMLFAIGIPMGNGSTTPQIDSPTAVWQKSPYLYSVYFGDTLLPTPGSGKIPSTLGNLLQGKQVNRPFLLGGAGAGGGMWGTYTFFGGWTDQSLVSPSSAIGAAISARLGGDNQVPGHRRQMLVSFTDIYGGSGAGIGSWDDDNGSDTIDQDPGSGFVLGESPNIDGFSFEVSSYGDLLFSMANPGFDFGGDADPAEVLYDLLTNPWARLGIDTAKIDTASFSAASSTLKAEGHGFSQAISAQAGASSVIGMLLQQTDGVLYVDPTTGLITYKLIRTGDPSVVSLDESSITSVDEYQMGAWRDLINEVRVVYTERSIPSSGRGAIYTTMTAVAQSFGNAIANGNRRKVKVYEFPGITNSTLAAQVAARELNLLSQPMATIRLTVNRAAIDLRPGMCFTVTYGEYNLSSVLFRCRRIDFGQLYDNRITIEAVQEAFATTYAGAANPGSGSLALAPSPMTTRTLVEAPKWLVTEAAASGVVTDPNLAHFLAMPVASANAVKYTLYTHQDGTSIVDSALFSRPMVDLPLQDFPISFTIAADYAREHEPYDTAYGITISNVSGGQWSSILSTLGVAGFAARSSDIQNHGKNLVCLIRSDGAMELVAFESMADLGGGQYLLSSIWRGLLDTPPIGFKAGDRGCFIDANMIGRRGWNITKRVRYRLVPCSVYVLGSGSDPEDIYTDHDETDFQFGATTLAERSALPLPPSDVSVDGDYVAQNAGTYVPVAGINSVGGHYKTLPFAEEALDLYGFKRDRLSATIHKGSDADDVLSDVSATSYWVYSSLQDRAVLVPPPVNVYKGVGGAYTGDGGLSQAGSALGGAALAGGGWRVDGYGTMDLSLAPSKTLTSGDPLIGVGGLYEGQLLGPWRYSRCSVFLPFWRNLLGNVRWNYRSGSADLWQVISGAVAVSTGSTALSGGSAGHYLHASSAISPALLQQIAFVDQWLPRGLKLFASAYIRNLNSNTNDTGKLTVQCLSNTGGVLATFSTAATIGSLSNWSRLALAPQLIPSNTYFLLATLEMDKVSGGSADPDTAFTEIDLRISPSPVVNVLSNYSFETYSSPTFTGWTNDTNSFLQATGTASAHCAQAGSFSSCQMHQDYAIPDGFQFESVFVATFFARSIQAGDRGTVTLQVLNGSGSVLESAATEAMNFDSNLSAWTKRTLYVETGGVPATLRVIVSSTRGVGNTSNGFQIDDLVLMLLPRLDVDSSVALDFSEPSIEQTPATSAAFVADYPTLPVPDIVVSGNGFNGLEVGWTDTAAHPIGSISGQFGNGVASIDAHNFVRGTGASAVHVAANDVDGYSVCNYKLTDSWSVSVAFRIDTIAAWAACGILGRMALAQGWGIGLDASGHGYVLLRGAGATTASATLSSTQHEGAYHRLTIVNDPVGKTITIYDEIGNSASASTAALGAIDGTSDSAQHIRLGRDADDHDVMPGAIGRFYAWDSVALSSVQVAGLSNYAKDPTGKITTYTRTASAYAFGPTDTNGDLTAYMVTANQVAIPYASALTVDAGTGYGLAVGKSATNLLPSVDWANSSYYGKDATVTLTTGIVGPTGRAQACELTVDATHGFHAGAIPLAASPTTVVVVFMAKSISGTGITINLLNSAGVLKGSTAVTLTSNWERYAVVLTGWDGSTANGWVKWLGNTGAVDFQLAEVLYVGQGTDVPALLPLPNATHGDYSATSVSGGFGAAFNARGEIVAVGCATQDSPTPTAGTVVQVKNGSNTKNEREIQIVAGAAGFRLAHTDGASIPATVNSTSAYSTYSSRVFTARGRWSRAGLLDNIVPQSFAEIAWTDDTHPTPTLGGAGRTAAWTNDTTSSTIIAIGTGTAAPSDLVLRSVTVRWPEEKLA